MQYTLWMPPLSPLWCKLSRQLAKIICGVVGKGAPEDEGGALAWFMT
jgi:hypothetical protein